MFFRTVKGTDKLCIYKEGKYQKETKYNIQNKIVDNQVVSIIGGTGSGKSVFMNVISAELNLDCDYTVVYVTEKKGDEFHNAFCCFEPEAEYHLNLLKRQKQESKTIPVKLYHPFTFNIPFRKLLPEIRWFTSSVKELNEIKLNAIMPTESEFAIEICFDISQQLDNNENMYDFLWKVFLATKDEVEDREKIDVPEELYTPPEAIVGKVTIKNIKQGLKSFSKDWYLHEHNSAYKLDYVQLLNDNSNWHFLSTKWLTTQRSRLIAIIEFLLGIEKALDSGKVRKKVVICLEELKILFPSGELSNQQQILMDIMYKLLSRIRTKAFVIGTMQSIFDIQYKFRGLFSKTFLGRLNFNDIRTLLKDFQFRVNDQEKLLNLRVGEFVLWESKDTDEKVSNKILIDIPIFANAEQNENFFNKYLKTYRDKCQNNIQFYRRMTKLKKQVEKKSALRLKKWYQTQKKLKQKKVLRKEGKVEELKQVIKKERDDKKEIIMKQIYDIKENNPSFSWRKISRLVKGVKTYNTVKKYYESYKERMKLIESAPKLSNLSKKEK